MLDVPASQIQSVVVTTSPSMTLGVSQLGCVLKVTMVTTGSGLGWQAASSASVRLTGTRLSTATGSPGTHVQLARSKTQSVVMVITPTRTVGSSHVAAR